MLRQLSGSDVVFDGDVAAVVEVQEPHGVVRFVVDSLGVNKTPSTDKVVAVSELLVAADQTVGRIWNSSSLAKTDTFTTGDSGLHRLSVDRMSTISVQLVEQNYEGVWGLSLIPKTETEVDNEPVEFAPIGHVPFDNF